MATAPRLPSQRLAPVAGGNRERFEKSLAGRFWLRWHMAVMLIAAFSAGFLTNIALLRWPLHDVLARWVVAFLLGYVVLFLCMRVWLAYIGVRPFGRGSGSSLDGVDIINLPGGGAPLPASDGAFAGEGGSFGGGGASGGWGDGAHAITSGGGGGGSGGGGGFGGDFDVGDGFVIVLIVLALAAALGGGVIFLIASAPHLLVDVAFGAAVTGGMAPAARRAANPDAWETSVWRATWKPFVAMLAVVVIAALAFRHFYPGAMTLGEAWMFYR